MVLTVIKNKILYDAKHEIDGDTFSYDDVAHTHANR